MIKNQYSKQIYLEYRQRLERSVNDYEYLISTQRLNEIQMLSTLIWRDGILAEVWGIIASGLGDEGIDYLGRWASGE